MRKSSSLKNLDTFAKGNLSMYIRASRLQSFNDTDDYIVDYLEEIVGLVNYEGGWTVYGWGKICLVNYVGLMGNDIKEPGDNMVFSQRISTHVLYLLIPKKYHLELSTTHGRSLDNLKFDFSTL